MRMIFRDRYLSDLIGFEYSRMNAHDAAEHFLDRIRQNTDGRECLVPIILDGENAWEWYEANGRPFLRELYRRISGRPESRGAHGFRGAGEIRSRAAAWHFPGLVDQREFRHLDRRGRRQPGLGTAAGRAARL